MWLRNKKGANKLAFQMGSRLKTTLMQFSEQKGPYVKTHPLTITKDTAFQTRTHLKSGALSDS